MIWIRKFRTKRLSQTNFVRRPLKIMLNNTNTEQYQWIHLLQSACSSSVFCHMRNSVWTMLSRFFNLSNLVTSLTYFFFFWLNTRMSWSRQKWMFCSHWLIYQVRYNRVFTLKKKKNKQKSTVFTFENKTTKKNICRLDSKFEISEKLTFYKSIILHFYIYGYQNEKNLSGICKFI